MVVRYSGGGNTLDCALGGGGMNGGEVEGRVVKWPREVKAEGRGDFGDL